MSSINQKKAKTMHLASQSMEILGVTLLLGLDDQWGINSSSETRGLRPVMFKVLWLVLVTICCLPATSEPDTRRKFRQWLSMAFTSLICFIQDMDASESYSFFFWVMVTITTRAKHKMSSGLLSVSSKFSEERTQKKSEGKHTSFLSCACAVTQSAEKITPKCRHTADIDFALPVISQLDMENPIRFMRESYCTNGGFSMSFRLWQLAFLFRLPATSPNFSRTLKRRAAKGRGALGVSAT